MKEINFAFIFLPIAQFVDAQAKAKSEKKDLSDARLAAGLLAGIGDKKKQVSEVHITYISFFKSPSIFGLSKSISFIKWPLGVASCPKPCFVYSW